MFLLVSVILLTGGCLPQCMLGADTPPRSRYPLEADTPQKQTPPGADTPWEQTPPTPLGADTPRKQTPPRSRHSPEADTPPKQTPPRSRHPLQADTPPPLGADSGIRSMSGRYASYWNAYLLFINFRSSIIDNLTRL